MSDSFIKFHQRNPVVVPLPEGETLKVFITDKNVMDDYSKEYYLNVNIPNRNEYHKLTDKMIEHYVYSYMVTYLKLFSIEGDIYIKFNYL